LHGFGSSGPSNWEGVGLDGAATALAEAIDRAADPAGVAPDQIEAAIFGLGGVDWPSDVDRLESVLEGLPLSGRHVVLNDAFIALRAGTDSPMGVVVVAGSGTTVAGRNRTGETFRTLGQGLPLFDDFGSASDVAESAVQAVARAFTGRGPETTLAQRLCEVTGVATIPELLEGLSRGLIPVPAAAPIVIAEANAGDAVASQIVHEAGSALGTSAAVAIRRLEMEEEAFDVVLSGGLFRGLNQLLWQAIYDPVHAAAPRASLVRLTTPPVTGAGLLALELAGQEVTPQIRRGLSEACTVAAEADRSKGVPA
jgi:N-acetylglucosamine kinase-like BadF-type ATPase